MKKIATVGSVVAFVMLLVTGCDSDHIVNLQSGEIRDNKAIVRSLLENNDLHNFDAALSLASEDFVGYNAFVPGGIHGNVGLRNFFASTEGVSFPDGKHTIHSLFGEGDWVTVYFTFAGHFTGALPTGTPPNGEYIQFVYTCICHVVGGKIVEISWFPDDGYRLMTELGII